MLKWATSWKVRWDPSDPMPLTMNVNVPLTLWALRLAPARFFFSSRRRHTRCSRDWSSDVCSSDLERPEQIDARLDQEREADAGDVGALRVREASPHPARQSQLGGHANAEGDGEPIVATEDAVACLAQHQDQRDEERDQVAGIQLAQPGPQRPASLSDGRRSDRGHASGRGSVTTWSWSTAGSSIVWTVPDGHRIMTRSARPVRPSPKCSRRSFWLANPTPPCTICSWRSAPNSTVTSAPMALRFDRVPTSLNAIQWLPSATVFLYTSAGCFWFATTTSRDRKSTRLNSSHGYIS